MFHFCYSLSQCQLGFFSLSRVERKGYTQMLNKKFSQLILVLKKKHIYIYLFQIWIQNLCTVFYPMFFSPPLPTCLLYYICNLRIALCMQKTEFVNSCKQRGQRLYQLNTHRQEMRLIDMIVNFFCRVLSMLDAPRVFDQPEFIPTCTSNIYKPSTILHQIR